MRRVACLCLVLTLSVAVSQAGCGSAGAPEPAPPLEEPTAVADQPTAAPDTPAPAPPTPTPVPTAEETPASTSTAVPPLQVSSDSFDHGGEIPPRHGLCPDPTNLTPAIVWSNVPPDAESLALICVDTAVDFVHWVIYNIPPSATGLPEGVPSTAELEDGTVQGPNDYGNIGYGGPCPPAGQTHTYVFTLYALDTALGLPAGADADAVGQAMEGHVLGQAELAGTYSRQ